MKYEVYLTANAKTSTLQVGDFTIHDYFKSYTHLCRNKECGRTREINKGEYTDKIFQFYHFNPENNSCKCDKCGRVGEQIISGREVHQREIFNWTDKELARFIAGLRKLSKDMRDCVVIKKYVDKSEFSKLYKKVKKHVDVIEGKTAKKEEALSKLPNCENCGKNGADKCVVGGENRVLCPACYGDLMKIDKIEVEG